MGEADWFFAENGQQVGPVTRQVLGEHVRAGRVGASSLVWRQGMAGWLPLEQSELAELVMRGGPPPVPGSVQGSVPPWPAAPGMAPGVAPGAAPGASTVSQGPAGVPPGGAAASFADDASVPGASFGVAFSRFWRKYVTFTGRASRSEYWFAMLGILLLTLAALALDAVLADAERGGFSIVSTVLNLAVLLPSLAIGVRRMHDIGRSGWWLLISFVPLVGAVVLLVFACTEGDRGPNRFGV